MLQSWVGRTIGGRYKIEALLGQGGMAAVYRATDPNLNRQVAIKLIHTHLSSEPTFINRFKEEAAAVARLRHPNIVQVHDFNIDDTTYFMVMEYLVGETLQTRLKRLNATGRQMPVFDSLRLCAQLGDAIGYAHKHGLIHRDIKPANIMLTLDDQAILMDFGIVKIIGGDFHTGTGATVGTAMYMSPEQIRSESIDERSDVYSLGVTLYEMLSGRPPYTADSALTLMMMILNDPLPDLQEVRKEIPKSLVANVNKALAKDPEERFQNMNAMMVALKYIHTELGNLSHTEPVTTMGDAETEHMANLVVEDQIETEIIETSPAKSQGTSIDISTKPQPFPSIRTVKTSKLFLRTLLTTIVVVIGLLFQYFRTPWGVQLTSISLPTEAINAQNSQQVVSLGKWETGSSIEELTLSPDGEVLGTANNRSKAFFSRYRFYNGLWQVRSGRLQAYLPGHSQRVFDAVFSPDGQLFGSTADDGRVMLWQVEDGILFRRLENPAGGFTSLTISPNNLILATGSDDGSVNLWQISDGNLLRTMQENESTINDVAFSPDGTLLAAGSVDNTILLWRVSDGSLLSILKGHSGPIHEVVFSSDGSLLASASEDRTIMLWEVSSGRLLQKLMGLTEAVYDVAFSPDSSVIASGSGDGKLLLWQVNSGLPISTLTEHSETITSVCFSTDGHLLVSGSTDGLIQFWGISEVMP